MPEQIKPEQIKLTVSHAPFLHNGSRISKKSYNIILAAMIPVVAGILQYGMPAFSVVTLAVGSAMFWEVLMNFITRRSVSIGDGNAAVIGLVFAMLLPAITPWWAVITGTGLAVIIGKQIYGGIGGNPFNPVAVAMVILMLSWKDLFDFNTALVNYSFSFQPVYPLVLLKSFGVEAVSGISAADLFMGHQVGGIGSTFGLGLVIAGVYLMVRGYIRWEISLSFLAGIFATALCFHLSKPDVYASPVFHLLTGYSLVGAFFLATEDSSSPVGFLPMLIYGALGGILTVLIRNIGAHIDGVVYAILFINLVNPLIDKIRPKASKRVIYYA
ncbi:MAG: RnfABCDGE type electron transport complex subunit D [Deltaproteobacteria bacterium]|nr:RnfABCDGE type electron transport complex subunit D [Deltaproteobacteria bacterium]